MEVLGGLARLNSDTSLPLPWWHRAPIGLLHKTSVYIALIKGKKSSKDIKNPNRPVGDLILTVLDPRKWEGMLRIDCYGPDKPGLISKVFAAVLPFNIAIAETVTLETGRKHHVTLICEPVKEKKALTPKEIRQIKLRLLASGIKNADLKIRRFFKSPPIVLWHDIAQIEHGWVHNVQWKEKIEKYFPKSTEFVDLNRVVVSADTTKRLVRYIFPMKGAVSIPIEHADEPGALKQITNAFKRCNANILSAILRRGGAKPGNAILVAVCEPNKIPARSNFEQKLKTEINKLNQNLRPELLKPLSENPDMMIYPKHPDDFVARVPDDLLPYIKKYQKEIPSEKIPIFFSRRFIKNYRHNKIAETIKDVLAENGCYAVEATPQPDPYNMSMIQVLSKMWLSKNGIVLVSSAGEADGLSINLAHEAGFLQGQGKSPLVLIEEGIKSENMAKWTNVAGSIKPTFSNTEDAFNPSLENSIQCQVIKWLNSIKKKK